MEIKPGVYRTRGGHTAYVWERGITRGIWWGEEEGKSYFKGTIKDHGMFAWWPDGTDVEGDRRTDLIESINVE